MTTKPLVAATDGSEGSLRAVEWAAREATLHGAPLLIVAAAELLPRMSGCTGGTGLDTVAANGAVPRGPGAVTHALLNHAHGPVVTVPTSLQPSRR
jgi:nucleotide-binding universal stress UspA family protein